MTHTVTPGENGRFEIVCHREHGGTANASLTSLEGEVSLVIDGLDPDESVEIEIIESNLLE